MFPFNTPFKIKRKNPVGIPINIHNDPFRISYTWTRTTALPYILLIACHFQPLIPFSQSITRNSPFLGTPVSDFQLRKQPILKGLKPPRTITKTPEENPLSNVEFSCRRVPLEMVGILNEIIMKRRHRGKYEKGVTVKNNIF